MKKSDQERRGNPKEFPASKKHVDATGEHHEVHAGAKQSQEHEKPCEPRLAMQILPGKGIDQCAQTRRETDVGHREPIGHQFDRGLVVAYGKPRAHVHNLCGKATHE